MPFNKSYLSQLTDSITANDREGFVELLAQHFLSEKNSKWAVGLMNYAASIGNLFFVQILAEKGFSFLERDSFGYSPFILAAKHGHLNIVCYLIQSAQKMGISFENEYKEALCVAAYSVGIHIYPTNVISLG